MLSLLTYQKQHMHLCFKKYVRSKACVGSTQLVSGDFMGFELVTYKLSSFKQQR